MPTLNDLIAEHAASVVLRDDHFGVAASYGGGEITVLLDELPREQDVRRAEIHAAAGVVADDGVLTVAGEEWRAAYVEQAVDGLQLVHAHLRLPDTLTLERAGFAKGASGAQVRTWADAGTLRGRVRETEAERVVEEDRVEVKPQFEILLEEPPAELGANERLGLLGLDHPVGRPAEHEDPRLLFRVLAELWE